MKIKHTHFASILYPSIFVIILLLVFTYVVKEKAISLGIGSCAYCLLSGVYIFSRLKDKHQALLSSPNFGYLHLFVLHTLFFMGSFLGAMMIPSIGVTLFATVTTATMIGIFGNKNVIVAMATVYLTIILTIVTITIFMALIGNVCLGFGIKRIEKRLGLSLGSEL